MRKIKSVHKAVPVNMGGIVLDQPLPLDTLEMVDPILLIHHWKDELPGDQNQMELGVGPHPHRGFSPVTVIYQGELQHRDSLGNNSIVKAGGTQWMVSGKGITHSERPSQDLAKSGGTFEIIQFWVNLPAKDKFRPAEYFPLQADETPSFDSKGVRAAVISGEFEGIEGGLDTVHDVNVVNLSFEANGELAFDIDTSHNIVLYQLDGEASVQDMDRTYGKTLYHFGPDDSSRINIKAGSQTRILLLSGQPLHEKVSQYGPFVLNTQTEVMQALRDAQMGKMGVLIED